MGRQEHLKYRWCVWGVLMYGLGLPQLKAACASWVYTSQAPGCSSGARSKADPAFCAPPRSKPLKFLGTLQGRRLGSACVLCPSQVEQLRQPGVWQVHCPTWAVRPNHLPSPSHSVSRVCRKSTVSGVPRVSSGELISECDPPGRCQPSRIPGKCG